MPDKFVAQKNAVNYYC